MANPEIPVAYATPLPPALPVLISSSSRTLRTSAAPIGEGSQIFLPNTAAEYEPQNLSPECLRELQDQGYTRGLAQALHKNKRAIPLSIWIVDNSGSMMNRDGHRLVSRKKNEFQVIPCTRWSEMQQTVEYHAQLAAVLKKPTIFRLLNDPGRVAGPQQFSVAERGDEFIDADLAVVCSTIQNASPSGVTPLASHLREIRDNVLALEPILRGDGTKVAIIIATDGIPTDSNGYSNEYVKREFSEALRALEGLPVWVVVRLCTDEESVVSYWNDIDSYLELSLEVLDDFTAEAQEVHEHNKWLNYGLPLHRMREMGYHQRVFDMLDERKLARDELFGFFRILFGDDLMAGVPEPEVDWDTFVARISSMVEREEKQWNPLTKRKQPWVDIRKLKRDYGSGWFFW